MESINHPHVIITVNDSLDKFIFKVLFIYHSSVNKDNLVAKIKNRLCIAGRNFYIARDENASTLEEYLFCGTNFKYDNIHSTEVSLLENIAVCLDKNIEKLDLHKEIKFDLLKGNFSSNLNELENLKPEIIFKIKVNVGGHGTNTKLLDWLVAKKETV